MFFCLFVPALLTSSPTGMNMLCFVECIITKLNTKLHKLYQLNNANIHIRRTCGLNKVLVEMPPPPLRMDGMLASAASA